MLALTWADMTPTLLVLGGTGLLLLGIYAGGLYERHQARRQPAASLEDVADGLGRLLVRIGHQAQHQGASWEAGLWHVQRQATAQLQVARQALQGAAEQLTEAGLPELRLED
jgi:hypothetical protein